MTATPTPGLFPVSAPQGTRVLSPFWSDMILVPATSKIWYHVYYKYDPVDPSFPDYIVDYFKTAKPNNLDFVPAQVVQVTWENMAPHGVNSSTTEFITFQLVLMTDGVSTYLMYGYGEDSWIAGKRTSRPAAMAWQCMADTYYEHPMSRRSSLYGKLLTGNTGIPGLWSFKIDSCASTHANYDHFCYIWNSQEGSNATIATVIDSINSEMPGCPCNLQRAENDLRFEVDTQGTGICFATRFPADGIYGSRLCCYAQSAAGSLLTELPASGFLSLYNPVEAPSLYREYDLDPFTWCCVNSELCNLFSSRRPVDNCADYESPSPTFCYGDPHIKTIDNFEYTYNGLGEFTLITITNTVNQDIEFELQARTERARSQDDKEMRATVFTALAAKDYRNNGSFEIETNLGNDGLIVYIDDIDVTIDFYKEVPVSGTTTKLIKRDNSSVSIVQQNGITLTVSVAVQMLGLEITIPTNMKTNRTIRGLLGNADGDLANDLQLPNGTAMPSTASETDIYRLFGESWRIDSQNSLFHYRVGKHDSDYQHQSFMPDFMVDFNQSYILAAKAVCGGDAADTGCVYDYMVTAREDVARNTQSFNDEAVNINVEARNHAPVVSTTTKIVMAIINQHSTFYAFATDTDPNDSVTIVFDGTFSQFETGSANVSIEYNWIPTDDSPVNASVYAIDSLNASSSRVVFNIQLCSGCSGNGNCTVGGSNTHQQFLLLPCVCNIGWTGTDCSHDYDGCENRPCPEELICVDLTPAEQSSHAGHVGFDCKSCPPGYTLAEGKCVDIDECDGVDGDTNLCKQTCENTLGSYTCGCTPGYRANNFECLDIDECVEGVSACQQLCNNADGSYTCGCRQGYILDTTDKVTCIANEPTQSTCAGFNCDHGCTGSVTGEVNCFCRQGYQLSSDGRSCQDVDECNGAVATCTQLCTNLPGSFRCSCYDGFQLAPDGSSCVVCQPGFWGTNCGNECSNCSEHTSSCDSRSGCQCQPGWEGVACDVNVNECARSTLVCDVTQDCIDSLGSYECVCKSGYIKDTTDTCVNLDECLPGGGNNCSKNTRCIDLSPGYTCQCDTGFTGDVVNCIDIDECKLGTDQCDHVCINKKGSFNCDCHIGYVLQDDRRSCLKASDPCAGSNVTTQECSAAGAHGCSVIANTAQCFCRPGYDRAVNNTCIDINECASNNGRGSCDQICENHDGGFTCTCDAYHQLSANKISCQACNVTGTWGETCTHTCGCGAGADYCDSITGCKCLPGWEGALCDDAINACISPVCPNNQTCTNTQGGYECGCQSGFELVIDVCIDIDECSSSVTNDCPQRCINIQGSYRCACASGFQTQNDTTKCINLDECRTSSHECSQKCIDTDGSYLCTCYPGYILHSDRRSCLKDVLPDPCQNAAVSCDQGCTVDATNNPYCFCAVDYKLDPGDDSTCILLNNKVIAYIHLDMPFHEAYLRHGSSAYRDVTSDLRQTLLNVYHDVSNVTDVRIDNISPDFVVEHTVIFSLNNITSNHQESVASSLQTARTHGYIAVTSAPRAILSEPVIHRQESNLTEYVTCVLCLVTQQCTAVEKGVYVCMSTPDELTSVPINFEIRRNFSTDYLDHLTAGYASFSSKVKAALNALFRNSEGFAGIGPVTLLAGNDSAFPSTIVGTNVLFNETVGSAEKVAVARSLLDMENKGCLTLDADCVLIVGQTWMTDGRPAVCQTCAETEECTQTVDGLQTVFICSPTPTTTVASGESDLVLGLGIGIPLTVVFLTLMSLCCCIYCRRRRRRRDERDPSPSHYLFNDADPANVHAAFGSVSSALTGKYSLDSSTGGLFSRQYQRNWDRQHSVAGAGPTAINYYRDPDLRDPFTLFQATPHVQPLASLDDPPLLASAPPDDPPVVTSDFSWDFLYNALPPSEPEFRIQRPTVSKRPKDVFVDEPSQTQYNA